jgi:prepilin-type N-terminal cleavage/methylation domain-containing protein
MPSVKKARTRGFTLIEVLIGAFIMAVIAGGVYQTFASVVRTVKTTRVKTDAMMLANERIENARNLPYQDVGILNGVPAGKIQREETVVRSGVTFRLTASVRNVDDPFDGQQGSTTNNDLAAADYKQVEFIVACDSCAPGLFPPQTVVTTVAPRNLETATGNGSLFINVFNASGDPVPGATVHITKNGSSIDVSELSNNAGAFQLVDTPPGDLAYNITVSKNGFSSDATIQSSASNPNPLKPPSTVFSGQVTQMSFAIDLLSHLKINTIGATCSVRAGMPVRLVGQKRIGQSPDIFKYDEVHNSSGAGIIDLPGLEWDTYQFLISTSSSWALAGTLPVTPLSLAPGANQEVSVIIVPKRERTLLAVITDADTGLPLSGAQVTVGGQTVITSQGYFNQTDWSGGAGQTEFENQTRYAQDDGNLDLTGTPGEVRLRSSFGQFLSGGYLLSSVFDTGGTTTQFATASWQPSDQSPSTTVRLQIATGNEAATSTWTFRGPDGSTDSYYTVSGTAINAIHNGDQFVRYKLILETASSTQTPNVSDVSITYTSLCTPPGQAYFEMLAGDTQTITVTRNGYQPYSSTVSTYDAWQRALIPMQTL